MSTENRHSIDSGIEMLKGDTNPAQPSAQSEKAIDVANEFVAEQITETQEKLSAEFDAAVKDTMILAGQTMNTSEGKALYESLTNDKDAYIQAAINKTMLEKRPLEDAKDELDKILGSASAN